LNYIIFGGSGFIASHLIDTIKRDCLVEGDRILALDTVMPGEVGCVPGAVERIEGVEYARCDVRFPIKVEGLNPTFDDIVFDLAAVHRTPGHRNMEYYETNIRGAENVTSFASKHGIARILFTSSIAVYGSGEELKMEASLPSPETAYGSSKLVSEKIHEVWQAGKKERRLVILRPGVVFGKGEQGNFSRMHKGVKGRYFFYAGRKDTIKACIYVKDLAGFMKQRIIDIGAPGVELFNCSHYPAPTVEAICEDVKEVSGLKRKIPVIPGWALKIAASAAGPLGGERLGIHPDRVRKLMVSTNISGERMSESGYQFRYSLKEALSDWMTECGGVDME
jgi:nucleoside-diphosphate-sugar epimerase